ILQNSFPFLSSATKVGNPSALNCCCNNSFVATVSGWRSTFNGKSIRTKLRLVLANAINSGVEKTFCCIKTHGGDASELPNSRSRSLFSLFALATSEVKFTGGALVSVVVLLMSTFKSSPLHPATRACKARSEGKRTRITERLYHECIGVFHPNLFA